MMPTMPTQQVFHRGFFNQETTATITPTTTIYIICLGFIGFAGTLLHSNLDSIVSFIPLPERGGIDENNAILHKRFGTKEFVVRRIVTNIENTDFTGAHFRSPGEVTRVETKGTELCVSTHCSNRVNTLLSNLSHSRRTAQLKLTLLAKLCTPSSCCPALVRTLTCDTHGDLLIDTSCVSGGW